MLLIVQHVLLIALQAVIKIQLAQQQPTEFVQIVQKGQHLVQLPMLQIVPVV